MVSRGFERKRTERLRKALAARGFGGVVIAPGPNMRYYTGIESLMLERPFLMIIPVSGEVQLVAPTLESGPYLESPFPMKVRPWTDSEGPAGALSEAAAASGMKGEWGVEGRVPYGYLYRFATSPSLKLVNAEGVLQELRETKDEEEMRLLRESGAILSAAFERIPDFLRAGKTELEVAKRFSDAIYAEGATRVDDVLVQSGPRAADPHSLPSSRTIGRGESIVIDVGSTYKGYFADITRTFCLGRDAEVRRVYETVLRAEEAGISASAEGVRAGDVDRAARGVIAEAGLAERFFHRTGHGLGLEIHEAPFIVEQGTERLRSGMCFTVEPGVYLSGRLGVRIEDDVLIRGSRGRAITHAPKDFGWWS